MKEVKRSNFLTQGKPFPSHAPSPLLRTPPSPGHSIENICSWMCTSLCSPWVPWRQQAVLPPSSFFSCIQCQKHNCPCPVWGINRNTMVPFLPQASGSQHCHSDPVPRLCAGIVTWTFCWFVMLGVWFWDEVSLSHYCAKTGFEFVAPVALPVSTS